MSTLSVTTINTGNGTTDATLTTGNTTGGKVIVGSGGTVALSPNGSFNTLTINATTTYVSTNNFVVASNSSVNALSVNSTAGISTATNTFVIGSALFVSGSGNVGIGNSAPATELQIGGNYGVVRNDLSVGNNHNVNCALGNYFVVVCNSSAQNVYFTSTPANTVYSLTLRFSNGAGGNTISWANTPKWPGATAPTPSTNNDIWVFITDDGGANWRGNLVQKDSR